MEIVKPVAVAVNQLNDLIATNVMEIVKPDDIVMHIADGLLTCPEDVDDVLRDGWRMLKHTCNPRCFRRVGLGDGPENFKCRKQHAVKDTPDPTSHQFINLPCNLSDSTKVFFNVLASILLHLLMAHGMSNILYPIFDQQGTWHPVSRMLNATCLQLYPHTSWC